MRNRILPGFDEAVLLRQGGLDTAKEIAQQAEMLVETQALLNGGAAAVEAFLRPMLADAAARVILTGAGTSAFIGDSLAPWLAGRLKRRVESIATTDLVCAPELYFDADVPTLLVSFARSGNSPESLAAVELADRCVRDVRHFVVTCNQDGELHRFAAEAANGFALLLPLATHDHGFAMTSSYSSMLYAGLASFVGIAAMAPRVGAIAEAVQGVLDDYGDALKVAAGEGYERVAFLGSHIFKGTAREGALKLMELSNGQIVTMFDSPLGFRHGPKTFITGKTLVFVFLSNDPHTRRYETDLLDELRRDGEVGRVIVVTADNGLETTDQIRVRGLETAEDAELLFPYIVAPQVFAFCTSMRLGLTPDRPNASGTVNRVVQGVTIYDWA